MLLPFSDYRTTTMMFPFGLRFKFSKRHHPRQLFNCNILIIVIFVNKLILFNRFSTHLKIHIFLNKFYCTNNKKKMNRVLTVQNLHLGGMLQFSLSSHTPQFPLMCLPFSSVLVEHQGLWPVMKLKS